MLVCMKSADPDLQRAASSEDANLSSLTDHVHVLSRCVGTISRATTELSLALEAHEALGSSSWSQDSLTL